MISFTALAAATDRNFKQYIQPRTNNSCIPDSFRIGWISKCFRSKGTKEAAETSRKPYTHNDVIPNGWRRKRQFNSGWIPEYFYSVLALKQHERLQSPKFQINQRLFSWLNSIWLKHIQPEHAHPHTSAHIRTEANAITRCYTAVSIDNPSFKQKNRIKFIILVAAVGFIFDLFVVAADLLVGGKCFTNGRWINKTFAKMGKLCRSGHLGWKTAAISHWKATLFHIRTPDENVSLNLLCRIYISFSALLRFRSVKIGQRLIDCHLVDSIFG